MIEKILERLEALKGKDICFGMSCEECYKKFGIGVDCDEAKQKLMIDQCKEIVQEVAKEYGNNIILDFLQFVRDNANNEDGWALSDLIILATEYQKGE